MWLWIKIIMTDWDGKVGKKEWYRGDCDLVEIRE